MAIIQVIAADLNSDKQTAPYADQVPLASGQWRLIYGVNGSIMDTLDESVIPPFFTIKKRIIAQEYRGSTILIVDVLLPLSGPHFGEPYVKTSNTCC